MNAIQPWHIILVVLAFVILFGSRKLPDAARGLGRSLRIFKSEINEMRNDDETGDQSATPPRELPTGGEASQTGPESAPSHHAS